MQGSAAFAATSLLLRACDSQRPHGRAHAAHRDEPWGCAQP